MSAERVAARDNAAKPPLATELLWFDLDWIAAHAARGRVKYPDVDGKPNWTLGGKPDAEYLDAAMRHLTAMVRGQEYDRESGTHHAAAVVMNMLMMLTCNYAGRPRSVDPTTCTTTTGD